MRKILLIFILVWFSSCNSKSESKPDIIADVDYTFSGCFGGGKENLKIVDRGEEVVAILMIDRRKKVAVLDDFKMQAYNVFIKELRTLNSSGICTTTASYTARTGSEVIEKTDHGCSWNGWSTLTQALFR